MYHGKWLWTGLGLTVAGILSIGLIPKSISDVTAPLESIQTTSYLAASPSATTVSTVTLPTAWLLKLEGDCLAVYAEGEPKPLETYDLSAAWLPDYDRILLEYGMRVDSESDLRRLIEENTS